MTSTGKKRKNPLRNASSVVSPFHLEMDKVGRGMALLLNGVKGVAEFSEQSVRLLLCDMAILINGSGMCITVYENKSVEIVGRIGRIDYLYDKN